jgi:hypothetical protein
MVEEKPKTKPAPQPKKPNPVLPETRDGKKGRDQRTR